MPEDHTKRVMNVRGRHWRYRGKVITAFMSTVLTQVEHNRKIYDHLPSISLLKSTNTAESLAEDTQK